MPMRGPRAGARGMTLPELMIAVLVLAIVGSALVRLLLSQNRFFSQQQALRSARMVSRAITFAPAGQRGRPGTAPYRTGAAEAERDFLRVRGDAPAPCRGHAQRPPSAAQQQLNGHGPCQLEDVERREVGPGFKEGRPQAADDRRAPAIRHT